FGGDRFANNGDAFVGFWFNQNQVSQQSGGTFNGLHTVGDLLVLANFTNGGVTQNVQVYEWVGGASPLQRIMDSSVNPNPGDATVVANTSATPITVPWPYVYKNGSTTGSIPQFSFFEGGVDVTDLLASSGVGCLHYQSFIVETRSSQQTTAV